MIQVAERLLSIVGKNRSDYAQQSESEKRTIERFNAGMDRARQVKEEIAKSRQWGPCMDFYMGKHYTQARGRSTKAKVKFNYAAAFIDTIIPILTDSRPEFQVRARRPEQQRWASFWLPVLKHIWEFNKMDLRLPELLKVDELLGTGILKVTFDPFLKDGAGEVALDSVNPTQLFVDPFTPNSDPDEASWMAQRLVMTPLQLKLRFDRDEPQEVLNNEGGGNKRTGWAGSMTVGGQTVTYFDVGQPSFLGLSEEQRYKPLEVWELWEKTPEFPKGRTCYIANNRFIRSPIPNHIPHGRFPYVFLNCNQVPGSIWGKSDMQDMLPVQSVVNTHVSQIVDYLTYCVYPQLKVPDTMGKTDEELRSAPNKILRASTATELAAIDYLNPPPLPPTVLQFVQFGVQSMEKISGIHDALQGQRPEATVSGRSIAMLVESAVTRIRIKQRAMEEMLKKAGQIAMDLAGRYYNEERVVRLIGPDGREEFHQYLPQFEKDHEGNTVKFFDIVSYKGDVHEEDNPDLGVKKGDPKGEYVRTDANPELDVEIVVGSSLPVSKAQRTQMAMDLRSIGCMSRKSLLDYVDWVDAQKVLKELDEEAAAMAGNGPPPPMIRENYNVNIDPSKMGPQFIQSMAPLIQQMVQAALAQQAPPPPPPGQAPIIAGGVETLAGGPGGQG